MSHNFRFKWEAFLQFTDWRSCNYVCRTRTNENSHPAFVKKPTTSKIPKKLALPRSKQLCSMFVDGTFWALVLVRLRGDAGAKISARDRPFGTTVSDPTVAIAEVFFFKKNLSLESFISLIL